MTPGRIQTFFHVGPTDGGPHFRDRGARNVTQYSRVKRLTFYLGQLGQLELESLTSRAEEFVKEMSLMYRVTSYSFNCTRT